MTQSKDEVYDKYALIAHNSVTLMGTLDKAITSSSNHMLTVIRWNQMELALLRTLETHIREDLSWEDWSNKLQDVLLQLDDFREELDKQQRAALEQIDPLDPDVKVAGNS